MVFLRLQAAWQGLAGGGSGLLVQLAAHSLVQCATPMVGGMSRTKLIWSAADKDLTVLAA